ncbi:hypothetical protein [Arthrobacter cheniae]|uniref:hypothetical protein n=1 Tax=Arthrobacter cheniae TaxID=1258888 RepID=UPI0011C3F67B|nr:hypothetical protein [Arthrobacter cheniae]
MITLVVGWSWLLMVLPSKGYMRQFLPGRREAAHRKIFCIAHTQIAQRKLDEAKLKFERALPGDFNESDETEDGELEGQADALTELT